MNSVHFVFSRCLCPGPVDKQKVFGVLHITGKAPVIERPVEVSGSHVTWSVSSLSPLAAIVQMIFGKTCHAAVLLYRDLSNHDEVLDLRCYLAPNNPSHLKVRIAPRWKPKDCMCDSSSALGPKLRQQILSAILKRMAAIFDLRVDSVSYIEV